MPIGVPRIIYCWGEELPAQWTDIYNFIFRRRMVFLMQYLDDELCNQICGLLINIHMEDRSKELEKKEMEKSGLFKSQTNKSSIASNQKNTSPGLNRTQGENLNLTKKQNKIKSVEDLLTSDQDFAIDDNHMLEQYTLQKITTEWLNWNAQFFDYSDEPYLYYLAEILSKDFTDGSGASELNLKNGNGELSESKAETAKLILALKALKNGPVGSDNLKTTLSNNLNFTGSSTNQNLDVYSPFRLLANFAPQKLARLNGYLDNCRPYKYGANSYSTPSNGAPENNVGGPSLFGRASASSRDLSPYVSEQKFQNKLQNADSLLAFSEKALGQRHLKRQYTQDRYRAAFQLDTNSQQSLGYLGTNGSSSGLSFANDPLSSSLYGTRKQTQQVMQEEESKKVFMIINSFGGSVGNGITVHDALQFIKAGSLTLALGVAASAASLALAGGTIGERYVTEGCHTMLHQPEGGLNGQASDIWIDSQEIMKIRSDVADIYSLSTYRPRHKILRDLDRDFYLTAMETVYYGLADEIATNEVMHEIIEMTNKVWSYHDTQQERNLEARDRQSAGLDTQTQS
jgi:ATP-dependent Clp protease, protease subunit